MISMTQTIEEIRRSICSEYSFETIGNEEYLVHTGMYYDDGDELHIVMKLEGSEILLTDEGHTLMWLSYEGFNFTETRTRLRDGYIAQNNVDLDGGRIQVRVGEPGRVGPALSSLMQAILQIASLRNLNRSNVVNTFSEDVMGMFRDSSIGNRCQFGRMFELKDGSSVEPDIYFEGERGIMLFIAGNPDRAKEVVINLLLMARLDSEYYSIVIIDDNANISGRDRKRLESYAGQTTGMENALSETMKIIKARSSIRFWHYVERRLGRRQRIA